MECRTNGWKSASRVAAAAALLGAFASTAMGQYVEVEPNNNRATATPIPADPGDTYAPGETITGFTTGTSTSDTATGTSHADYFQIRTDTAAPNIYKQRLTATGAGTSQAYPLSIPGFSQTNRMINLTSDSAATSSSSSSAVNPKYVQWYGFGKGETINFKITGTSTTNGDYTIEFTREVVMPMMVSQLFSAGSITITTVDQGPTTDTEFWVYDSNFNAIPEYGNDDESIAGGGTGTTTRSLLTRNFAPGIYYIAISSNNLANDQPNPFDDDSTSGNVFEHPNAVANSATFASSNQNLTFRITDSIGNTEQVPAMRSENYEVVWARFEVGAAQNILATGMATPSEFTPGTDSVQFTVNATPAPTPPNTITSVVADLSNLGGSATQAIFDDGLHGDGAAGDNVWGFSFVPPASTAPGTKVATFTVSDNGGRTVDGSFGQMNALPVVPANDTCDTATVLSGFPLDFSATIGINMAGSDGAIGCSSQLVNNGIWFRYTPSQTAIITLSETGSRNADWEIYEGNCPGSGGFPVLCSTSDTNVGHQLTANTPYWILVGTAGSASTNPNDAFVLSISAQAPPPAPANDLCSGAIAITPASSPITVMNAAGAGSEPQTGCQTGSSDAPEARNGVWFTYTTGANDELARFTRTSATDFFSLQILTGTCGNFVEYDCINLGTSLGSGSGVPLRRNTTYYLLAHRRATFMPADGFYQINFEIGATSSLSNTDCATAEPIMLDFSASVDNTLGFNEPSLTTCPTSLSGTANAGGAVWYSLTPTMPVNVLVEELGSQDAAMAAFEGSCGGLRVMCSKVDTNTSNSNRFRAYPGNTYYIVVMTDTTGIPAGTANPLQISITGTPIPVPSNDDCATATQITALPFSETTEIGTARDDIVSLADGNQRRPVCSLGTVDTSVARNGIWYRYTNGSSPAAAIMSDTGATAGDTFVATYKGVCGALVPVSCNSDTASNRYLYMEPNTTYYILTGYSFGFIAGPTNQVGFNFDVLNPAPVAPPANDDCVDAQLLSDYPFVYTDLPVAASHDLVSNCANEPVNLLVEQATNPLWYRIESGSGFTLNLYETTSANAVNYALYVNGCDIFTRTEVQCTETQGTSASPVAWTLDPGTTYHLMVARNTDNDYTLGATPYNLTITAAAGTTGACCNGSSCSIDTVENCAGDFQPGQTCETSGCCPTDINGDGTTDATDIFVYLDSWFAQNGQSGPGLSADFDGSGTVDATDIFIFLDAWFANNGQPC